MSSIRRYGAFADDAAIADNISSIILIGASGIEPFIGQIQLALPGAVAGLDDMVEWHLVRSTTDPTGTGGTMTKMHTGAPAPDSTFKHTITVERGFCQRGRFDLQATIGPPDAGDRRDP